MAMSLTTSSTDEPAIVARLQAAMHPSTLPSRLRERGAALQARCLVGIGSQRRLLIVDRGEVSMTTIARPLTPSNFSLLGSVAAWTAYWQPMPEPGWHDLLALAKRGEITIEGDLLPFMTHLQFWKDLLALPRAVQ